MRERRKHRLVDCNPKWVSGRYQGAEGTSCGIKFDCPEGHKDCWHSIPFTPDLAGTPRESWQTNGAVWQRTGETFETLSLSPSIRREPVYASREAALAAGAQEEHLEETHFCALHIFIKDGAIEFCGDSK
jgi:hypothetical protein